MADQLTQVLCGILGVGALSHGKMTGRSRGVQNHAIIPSDEVFERRFSSRSHPDAGRSDHASDRGSPYTWEPRENHDGL